MELRLITLSYFIKFVFLAPPLLLFILSIGIAIENYKEEGEISYDPIMTGLFMVFYYAVILYV